MEYVKSLPDDEKTETLKKIIMEQTDLETLRTWLKAAARAKSIEDFEQTTGLIQM